MNFRKKTFSSASIYAFLVLAFFSCKLYSFEKNNLKLEYFETFAKAEKFRKDGYFDKSINLFEKSLNIAKLIKNEKEELESLLKLGLLYWNIGNIKESSAYYEKALEIAQKCNLKTYQDEIQFVQRIYKLYEEGKKNRLLGYYQKSIENFNNAINLTKEIKSKEHEVKCLRQLSINYWELNKFQEFNSLNEEALKKAKELSQNREIALCLNNIGLFYWKLNNYSKALTYFSESINISQKENNKENEAACLNNIGLIYLDMGSYEKALEYLLKALSILKDLGNQSDISRNLNTLGETYRRIGIISRNKEDFTKALSYFMECLKIAKEANDRKTEIQVLNNIGSVQTEQENHKEALKYFGEGLKKAEEAQDFEMMSMVLTNIGIVYYKLQNYDESSKYYEKAINLAFGREQILWETYMESARAYEKEDKLEKALERYKYSIYFIEKIRSSIFLEDLKARYLGTDKRIDAYHYLINLLVTYSQPHPEEEYKSEAYNYLERAKARAFLDRLEISRIDINQGVEPELLNREKELMNDSSKLFSKLLSAEPAPEEKNMILEQIKEKENEMDRLLLEMRTKSPLYAGLRYPEIITLRETQEKLLNNNIAFFEYCIGNENSYAFVITKRDLKIFPVPARDKIKKAVKDYLEVISDKDNNNFQAGYELFKTLVSPGLDKNIKTIIFLPDDILYYLPFETLITNKDKNDWLIENYKVAYAPSASSLREIIQRKRTNKQKAKNDILAFGNPYFGTHENETNNDGNDTIKVPLPNRSINLYRLKYSGSELDIIGALFAKSKQKIFQKENASEEQLKDNNLAEYKVIHFATHSIIDDNKPDYSSIVLLLDEDPNEDGLLQTREIYNLKLNSDLVTLSACETGLGELIRGEGIVGLNKAFFYAGTSAVLMSLWAVNDQASCQLMEWFYRHLKSSESIMEALRKVKLEMIDSEVLSHPYYWAGFVVSGKADEIIFPKSTTKWLLLGVSLVLAGAIIFAAVRSLKQRL